MAKLWCFDLESMTMLRTARVMRDKGHFLNGRPIESPPQLFLGAVSNPFAPPYDFRPLRLAKKVQAGADFIQTQYCFDVGRMRSFMGAVRDPMTGEAQTDLRQAQAMIDMLTMVEEKTKGNLVAEETEMVKQVLNEVRTHFIKASSPPPPAPEPPQA